MGDPMIPAAAQPQAGEAALDFVALNAKYAEEKEKRMRAEGAEQFEELKTAASQRLRQLEHDPWVDHDLLNAQTPALNDGDEVQFLILGAGFGGLLYAIRLIQQGFKPSGIRLVDVAGGFGGTWWWNRFPGLMCDTEGYTYLPLLEETGYVPKHRYSYGPELLSYAKLLADKWDLTDKGVFRSAIQSYEWDEAAGRWIVEIEQGRGPEAQSRKISVRSQFVIVANGVLNHPKVPKNLAAFEGPMTHTARFDYNVTGGKPEDPRLTKLEGKRVGIIGTGATAIQVVPELAKWAKELYVFQRTPSGVSEKGQYETKPEEWKTISSEPGWQRRRIENFCAVMSGEPVAEDLVKDGWTTATAYRALIGGAHEKPLTMEDVPGHMGRLLAEDAPRTDRIRRRVDETVEDEATAAALKAWYPTWCKRPTFHDEYLPTFNLPHVHLVDTEGKGVDKATATGVVVGDKEYPVDVLVLSTGYRSPAAGMSEPGAMSDMTIRGRNGVCMADKWKNKGPSTVHGVLSHDFPNLFLTGPMQTGASSNFAHVQDVLAEHCAYIASEAVRRAGPERADKVVLEGTEEGENFWAAAIMERAMWMAGVGVCGPGYQNNEGSGMGSDDPALKMKMARGAPYALGMNAYSRQLKAWREEGKMKYVEINC